jgi:hypothetical protein
MSAMADELRVLPEIFPVVVEPDEEAWQRVLAQVASAAEDERRSGGRARPRHGGLTRAGRAITIVGLAASLVAVGLLALPTDTHHQRVGRTSDRWRLASAVGPPTSPFRPLPGAPSSDAIVCPTAIDCYISGEVPDTGNPRLSSTVLYASRDGGMSFHRLVLPSIGSVNTNLTCPTAHLCMVGVSLSSAYRQLLLTTSDGGLHWTRQRMPGYVSQLICFNASTCFGFGDSGPSSFTGTFLRTDDGGAHWTRRVLLPGSLKKGERLSSSPEAFSCPTINSCVGVSSITTGGRVEYGVGQWALVWRTDNGGDTWSDRWIAAPLADPSCWDAIHCVAIDNAPLEPPRPPVPSATRVLETSDGGESWHVQPITGRHIAYIQTLTCVASGECVAGGFSLATGPALVVSHNGGHTWTNDQVPPRANNFVDLDCPTSRSCFAIAYLSGGYGETTEVFTDNPIGRP